jgi:hypothetical protein
LFVTSSTLSSPHLSLAWHWLLHKIFQDHLRQ